MEKPIILKAHEVRGILDGRQTQLRRIVKQLEGYEDKICLGQNLRTLRTEWCSLHVGKKLKIFKCPLGQVGDRLWGRETMCSDGDDWWFPQEGSAPIDQDHFYFPCAPDLENDREDVLEWMAKQRIANRVKVASTQMPRWASRILLEIVSVRVERLQDMTDADAYSCGVQSVNASNDAESYEYADKVSMRGPKQAYLLSQKDEAAWCWVIEFKRVEA